MSEYRDEIDRACAEYIDAFARYERERRETGGEPSEYAARAVMEADDLFSEALHEYVENVPDTKRVRRLAKAAKGRLYEERVWEAALAADEEERGRMVQDICDGFAYDRERVERDVGKHIIARRPTGI